MADRLIKDGSPAHGSEMPATASQVVAALPEGPEDGRPVGSRPPGAALLDGSRDRDAAGRPGPAPAPVRGADLDPAAVFREHAPYVHRALRYLGVAPADIEDAAQEVFLVVLRRLVEFEGRAQLRTWIHRICWRVAQAHRRKSRRTRQRFADEEDGQHVPDPNADGERTRYDARQLLVPALDQLDEPKRVVFVLYEIEGLTMPEVAQALDCPLQTAYSRLYAAREAVARHVRARLDEGTSP